MSVAASRLLLITLAFLALLLTVVSAQGPERGPLTNADNGKTLDAKGDDVLQVNLKDVSGEEGIVITYGEVTSSDENVVAPVAESRANFKVVGTGTADLTAKAT
ncbi:hypothetical protein EC968_005005, partial [Mortierella alpina]